MSVLVLDFGSQVTQLIARRVRELIGRMSAQDVIVPAGFEPRLMARIREDRTLLDLIDLGLLGVGRALVDLLNALLSLLPAPAAPASPQPAL